jgi:N-acetylglucosaminyldiphosphoundecaprenol N-acetyl-beta-D-mannosaminyltransferase
VTAMERNVTEQGPGPTRVARAGGGAAARPAGTMIDRANILGVGVSAINIPIAVDTFAQWIAARRRNYVCVTGVHGVMESHRDPELRAIHNRAGLVTPDGMPLVWIARAMGFRQVARVYGPDLMLAACERSIETGWRHFFYGGAEGIPELLARSLMERFPRLQVAGTCSPPFRELTADEDDAIVGRINAAAPDIVWVGISTPKQERWMAAHTDRIDAPVLVGCGAAFDFHAGVKRQAPRWMMRAGLEWTYRMATEPRRLGPRYLINNPMFVGLMLRQFVRRMALGSE